jgi:hypothetical protein
MEIKYYNNYWIVGIFMPALFVLIFATNCSEDDPVPSNMVDSGSWYETGFTPWPHDGNPLEGEHFVIYSDAASLEARKYLLQICEDVFKTIKERLGITDVSVFKFPEGRNNKIHIYAYKNYAPANWGGQAFYGGYLIYSSDNPVRTEWGDTAPEYYVPVVQHEIMHVIQTLIVGDNNERVYSWFAEGIAIEVSDSILYTKIDTRDKLNNLIATYGKRNPISIQHSRTMPTDIEYIGTRYYYPMFWLSVRYLTDPAGQGKSFHDVRDVLIDVGNQIPFRTSFETRFGISLSEYEEQFFDLINDFLN